MNLFISGTLINMGYYLACCYLHPNDLDTDDHLDFINAYDGCAFE